MLLLILFVLFFIVLQNKTTSVTINELISNYSLDVSEFNKRFLNKELEISGKVDKLFSIEGKKSILELQSIKKELKVYCLLTNKELEAKAGTFTNGTQITIIGKCRGLSPEFSNDSSNTIYIEAEKIQ